MAFLTAEQKKALGPFLDLIVIGVAACAGIAVNTVFGGPKVPVVSEFSAIVLGVTGALIVHRNLTK